MSTVLRQTESDSRKAALARLQDESRSADVSDDKSFQELLNACQAILEMSDREIADVLMVSRPTVNRWSNGKNLPHRAVRKSMFNWISETASKKLRILEKYEYTNLQRASLESPHARVA